MHKIGILTYHHVANWGSALQAVCLYKLLESIYPKADIRIIDYIPETSDAYNSRSLYRRKQRFKIKYNQKNEPFYRKMNFCKQFILQHCNLTDGRVISDDAVEGNDFIGQFGFDKVFVGSDTVLQLGPYIENVYIAAPQAPNLYFLPFKSGFDKIGVAVSIDPFSTKQLDKIETDELKNHLNDFKMLFYRDKTTEEVFREIGVSDDKLSFLPDPSLLIDFGAFCSKGRAKTLFTKYAAIAVGNRNLSSTLQDELLKMGYKTINLLGGEAQEGLLINQIDDFDSYVQMFRSFELLITDRFHGSIKGLVLGDYPIVGIEDEAVYPNQNSKLRDLFSRLDIDKMLIRYNHQMLNVESINQYLNQWIWSKAEIQHRLNNLRLTGYESLRNSGIFNAQA
jgi:hypothetical protein